MIATQNNDSTTGRWKTEPKQDTLFLARNCRGCKLSPPTGLKNGWTCALKLWGSSRHSIFKMADDEWKFYTSFWRLFATSCSPKAFKFCVTEHNEDCCLGLMHDGANRNGGVILMKRSTQRLLKQYFTFSEFSQGTVLPWYKVVSASIRF